MAARGPVPGFVPAEDARVVFVTAPPAAAPALARALVDRRLAACVNAVPGLTSTYRWQGTVHADPETLLVVKTTKDRLPELLAALHELHPYDVPEALSLVPDAGSAPYLAWLTAETRPRTETNGDPS
jgi:periplasmic divalent cation tolerance protein